MFVLALVVRLVYLVEASDSPAFRTLIVDSQSYDQHARYLLAEHSFYNRFFWQGFFYPFHLAIVYLVTGGSVLAARLVQIVLGSAMCVLVAALGGRIFDRRTGVVAGVIAALYGPLVFYDAEILDTGFSALWAVALLLLVLKAREAVSRWWSLAFGIAGGLAIVTRGTFLPFFVAAVAWLAWRWGRARAASLRIALVAAGFIAVALPVAELSRRSTGETTFLSQSGPINLYIGNNAARDSTIMIRPGAAWRELTRMPMVQGSESDAADRTVFRKLFLDYVRKSPGDYARGLVDKTVQFWSTRELARNDDIYVARDYSKLLSMLVWKAGRFGFPFGILLPLAVIGIARYWRRIPLPVYLFIVLYSASVVAVFVSGRYRIPLVPVLAAPAAAGLLSLFKPLKGRALAGGAAVFCAAIALTVATSAAGPFAVERYDYRAEMHTEIGSELLKQGRVDAARAELLAALAADPDRGDAHKYLGLLLAGERRHAEAAPHFEKALASDPDSYLVRYYLGTTLFNLGKREEGRRYLEEAREGAVAAREDRLVEMIDRMLGR